MKILYVPFTREQAGDLAYIVQLWQINHLKNFPSSIRIAYFNEEIHLDLDMEPAEIFVCAHGGEGLYSSYLANNSDFSTAALITIETLAYRFNQDFLYHAEGITQVHLYCCGSFEKNQNIANQFNANLMGTYKPVIFYSGFLTIADENGTQWSFGDKQAVPVNNKARIAFYSSGVALERAPERRKSIKELPDYEANLELRRNHFFKGVKERRANTMEAYRNDMMNQSHP